MMLVTCALTAIIVCGAGLVALQMYLRATLADSWIRADVRRQLDEALGRLHDAGADVKTDLQALKQRVAQLEAAHKWANQGIRQ